MKDRAIQGVWLRGPHAGMRSIVDDVQGGLVRGTCANGGRVLGLPDDFLSDTGESGEQLLSLLLPKPRAAALFRGAIRESIAALRSLATHGQQETRAWDDRNSYVVDDGEGNCGIVVFGSNGAVGAIYNHDAQCASDYNAMIATVPADQLDAMRALIELPIFRVEHAQKVTALFWTVDEYLCGPRPWHRVYACGAELMRRELMTDQRWAEEAREYYCLDQPLTRMILQIVERSVVPDEIRLRDAHVVLSMSELASLVPANSEHHRLAMSQIAQNHIIRIG